MLVELRKLVADWEASVDAKKPKPQSQPWPGTAP